MKYLDIIFLFYKDIVLIKEGKNPYYKNKQSSLPFILKSYYTVLNTLIKNSFQNKKIYDLPITKKMKEKLINISTSQDYLNILEKINNSKKLKKEKERTILKLQLTSISGIGYKKADELINKGLTSIKQLYSKKWMNELPQISRLYLKYKPTRIIYKDIQDIEKKIINTKNNKKIIFVGSYRRKCPCSSDIDIMYIGNIEEFNNFIKKIQSIYNNIYIYSKGKDKTSFLLEYSKNKVYKLDVFRTSKDTSDTMLLYSTGSKNFNIKMRNYAKRKGYLLNQLGLFKNNKKINKPHSDPYMGEKNIFRLLNYEWKEPYQRI